MENSLFELTPVVLALVPVVMAIVQLIKELGLPGKWAPLLAVAAGIGLSLVDGLNWPSDLTQGLVVGLVASGVFSGGKALVASKPQA